MWESKVKDSTVMGSGHRRMLRLYVWNRGQAGVMMMDLIRRFPRKRESTGWNQEKLLRKDTRFWLDDRQHEKDK